jgi:hypothetical protein
MIRIRILTALAATSAALAASPTAFAHVQSTGNANGTPAMNICVAQIDCTYVNFRNGKPTDVVKHNGTIVSWSLNAASTGGQVRLRILRPVAGGKFLAVHTSMIRTVSLTGLNIFPAHIKVRRGDVLALENSDSGLYMANAPAGTCIRYFGYMDSIADGSTAAPNRVAPQLHTLLSAELQY